MKPAKDEPIVKCEYIEHKCLFKEEMLENLNYLSLDDAQEFVQNIILENLQEFEETQDQKLDQEMEEMRDLLEEKLKTLDDFVNIEIH
jgi:hypothetical protein